MRRKTLDLTIGDQSVVWNYKVREPGADEDADKGRGASKLALDPATKENVDLLVKLQRWLGDALADQSLPVEKMVALDERLADLTRILGQNLYRALFCGESLKGDPLRTVFEKELGKLEDQDVLRVQLEFEGATEEELSGWPWEYMYIRLEGDRESSGQYLLDSHAQLVLTRRVHLTGEARPLTVPQPIRVLLICAAPQGLGPVHHEQVLEGIKMLAETGAIELVSLIEPKFEKTMNWKPTASFDEFERLVTADPKPQVIHFIGHGQLRNGAGELAFVGSDGKPDWHSDFAKVVARNKELKLVFLQACESALPDPHTPISSVARKCAHHNVPAVVAMQAKIKNAAASAFACRFYETLGEGKSVDFAVLEGRHALSKQPAGVFGVPVLFLRSYEKLIGPKRESITKTYLCPRCSKSIPRATPPKVCPCCGLRFFCFDPKCNHQLAAPAEKDAVLCDECGYPCPQPPWPRPSELGAVRPATPTPDLVEIAPSEQTRTVPLHGQAADQPLVQPLKPDEPAPLRVIQVLGGTGGE